MKPAVKRYLENIYYDPEHPGSFSGVDRLHRAVKSEGKHKISRKRLEEFLRTQETYGVHRKSTSKFPRPKVVVSGVGIQADADLADLSALARFNDGYKFVLVHVDVFSKYSRKVPLRSKTAGGVTQAFRKVFESGGKTSSPHGQRRRIQQQNSQAAVRKGRSGTFRHAKRPEGFRRGTSH